MDLIIYSRYGPFHPEMPIKLRQMNDVISQVVNAIDNDTLLLVMGDHGMHIVTVCHSRRVYNFSVYISL